MAWYGWVWKSNTWQRVTGPHETLSECSCALSKIAKARRIRDTHQVMTGGGPPRFVPDDTRVSQQKKALVNAGTDVGASG